MSRFNGVEAFVYAAELRSFRAAAERLERTPAAVSKAVSRLEARLGVRLLDRTTRRVALTPEGDRYLRRARIALDALRAGEEEAASAHQIAAGPLSVSASFVLGRPLVRALPRLLERHPRLDLDLRFSDRPSRLLEEGVDVALRIGALADSELIARPLFRLRWATVASPSYLERAGVPETPAALADHACWKFRPPGGGAVEWSFQGAPTPDLPTRHRADQGELLVEAALAGLGVVQAPEHMVREHLAAGRLVALLPGYAAEGPQVSALCRPHQQRTPRVRCFLEFVSEVFRAPGAR